MPSFQKSCPLCGTPQEYSSWDSLQHSIRKNTVCNSCRASTKKIIPENGVWKRVCKCGNEMVYSCRRSYNTGKRTDAICRNCAAKESSKYANTAYRKTEEYKTKISDALKKARKTDSYGEEFKKKCRENKLNQIFKQGTQRTVNINACKFMDLFSQQFGVNLQHGMNGGEYQFIGYSVDGYDKEKNVIFEYDEPKHHISSVAKKDVERQKRLVEHLHPNQFWRYDQKNNKLVEVVSNKEVICPKQ